MAAGVPSSSSAASWPRAAGGLSASARRVRSGNVTPPLILPPLRAVAAPSSSAPAAPADTPGWYSAQDVKPPRHGKHFLHLDDFSKDELEDMLARARDAKRRLYARDAAFRPFEGLSLAMIFTKPSARTRVSFETVRMAGGLVGVVSLVLCERLLKRRHVAFAFVFPVSSFRLNKRFPP